MFHLHLRHEHPRLQATGRTLSEVFWALAAGVIVAYVFFLALGAFGSDEVLPLTVAVLVLVALWCVHGALASRRARREKDPRLVRARERRGF